VYSREKYCTIVAIGCPSWAHFSWLDVIAINI
jgi:hypothetical protein